MWQELGVVAALLLIVEGIMPFANPARLRRMLVAVSELNDGQLRFAGLSSMLLGVLLLYILH